MKNYGNKIIAVILMAVLLCAAFPCAAAERPASILGADPIEEFTETEERFTNILLLGVDNGFGRIVGSGRKSGMDECHTDAFIIASLNMTTGDVNLISIPRDTVTYVPGVRGLYKLNAAINCGETVEDGLNYAMQAASWHLGGIKIDYFACVDMEAMVALGNFIGGVDVDVEMTYTSGGGYYHKGFQHLDGKGMLDYARVRKTASVNANDIGRTARQRQVVTAIIKKLRENPNMVKKAWDYATGGELNFYTDLKLGTVLNLANKAAGSETIGSYVLTGQITRVMDWNFTITDQANRKEVLKTVFGIDAEEIPYVGLEYLKWVEKNAIDCIHSINLGKDILAYGRSQKDLSDKKIQQLDKLEASINKTTELFFSAGETGESTTEKSVLYISMMELKKLGEQVKKTFNYQDLPGWRYTMRWNNDKFINEYQLNWN